MVHRRSLVEDRSEWPFVRFLSVPSSKKKSFIWPFVWACGAFVWLAAISASHLYFSSALNTAVRVWIPFYFLAIFIDRSSLSRCSSIVALFASVFLTAWHILQIFSMRYIAVVAPRPCPPFHCFLRPLQGGRFLYHQCWRFIRIPTYLPRYSDSPPPPRL